MVGIIMISFTLLLLVIFTTAFKRPNKMSKLIKEVDSYDFPECNDIKNMLYNITFKSSRVENNLNLLGEKINLMSGA